MTTRSTEYTSWLYISAVVDPSPSRSNHAVLDTAAYSHDCILVLCMRIPPCPILVGCITRRSEWCISWCWPHGSRDVNCGDDEFSSSGHRIGGDFQPGSVETAAREGALANSAGYNPRRGIGMISVSLNMPRLHINININTLIHESNFV